ncbi:MAG: F0F1 ATP synthase subunit gamma [Actinomyces urogenitalis]|uniref:ATP synthase gamma chain n=4 Tax=Actinomyces urogenitalis TaxID=103621 RepID=C0W6R0_9ACTO|nr:F0F1 ATP synthase subunit gamma [Actinomyces urogenitalis]EEH65584.1 ATP synthase F1, gamma subunit [Actinomyces urogenitalis DSM 15434]KGE99768.1 ATP synthase F0F1 subunit gamma [Actinomyces urogenitalis S6-C4]MBS5976703.1 F0F1 ATP synthase subunit gamma [Actinomyces urogenitalis]MBS6071163.1 F0F1 ATP synthase subunit gamma [Actinomyces urogenitalis]MDK8238251.1 F0F1 ATP synthase subunit gamma [Actinomyces urogenitalis]
MAGNQRVYKQRIRSTQTLQKVFRAMELIASSRIGVARRNAQEAGPYDHALSQAVAAVGTHSSLDHPITQERSDTKRVAVLVVTSDRGMAGAYSATVLRESERLIDQLVEEGKEPVVFTAGRRALSYFSFREREVERSWTGESDRPGEEMIEDIAQALLESFLAPAEQGGVAEVHIVFTRYVSMVSQVPEVRRMLPLTVVDVDGPSELDREDHVRGTEYQKAEATGAAPLYEFAPSAELVLDALLTRYVRSRIRNALLQAAASELASRQQAMHTATDNAEDLINTYTRLANQARQGDITQEISEIVSGADALAAE